MADDSIESHSGYILVVDDDPNLTKLVQSYLEQNWFRVKVAHDGISALKLLEEEPPRLVVLDLMLPGMDGLEVCREFRKDYAGPILMLTAMDSEVDEVTGLEMGADDYLGKPVRPRILLAHMRALLRRFEDADRETKELTRVQTGDLIVNLGSRQVTVAGELIELTGAEFDLLWLLARNAGRILPRQDIYRSLFNQEYDGVDRTVDLRVSKIRKKIGDSTTSPQIIKTVRGRGYLLAMDS